MALLWAMVLARPVQATDTHYQDFLIGERAAGMGGAFTALGDDGSGVYYNPAGLVDVEGDLLSLTMSVYAFQLGWTDDKVYIGDASADLELAEFTSFPSSLVLLTALRQKGQRRASHAFGLSILVPDMVVYNSSLILQGDWTTSMTRTRNDKTVWFGASYALALGSRWSVGLSAYYLLRILDYDLFISMPDMSQDSFVAYDMLHGSLRFVAGAKVEVYEGLTLGLAVRTPTVRLNSEGSAYGVGLHRVGGEYQRELVDLADVPTSDMLPLMVVLGAAYTVPRVFAVALDISLHLPVERFALFDLSPSGEDGCLGADLRDVSVCLSRHVVVNANVGGEVYLGEAFVLRSGLFTNMTSAPPLEPDVPWDLPHYNMYGLTLGLSWLSQYSTLTLNVGYTFGWGEDLGIGLDAATGYIIEQSVVSTQRHLVQAAFGGSWRF